MPKLFWFKPRPSSRSRRRLRPATLEPLEARLPLAYDFPLANAGFESPDLTSGNSWHPEVNGWITSGSVGTTYQVPSANPSPAPEGQQYAYGATENWSMLQAGPIIEANTRYIISVDLFPLETGTTRAIVGLQDSTVPQVLADQVHYPAWDPTRADFELPAGEWTTVKLGFNSTFAPDTVGHGTWLRIDGHHLAVDNVTVTVDDGVHDFYISSSTGLDSHEGFSAAEPWQGFDALAPYMPLVPGERILLKAGDVFTDELNIRGKGTADEPVALTSYGDGPNPVIRRHDLTQDIGVVWNNASYADISYIDVEHAKLGIYLRYEWTDSGSRNVTIEHANFRDLTDPTLDPSQHNFEFAWSDAIWVGGQAWNQAEFSTRLENLTIRHVTSENAAHLFGTGWYHPGTYKSRIKNLIIEDSVAINNLAGTFQLFSVDGGHIKRVHAIGGGGQDTWSGTTLGFIQDSKNFLIEDNVFANIDRAQAADGSGMDFEGNTENVTFRGNTIYGNAGSALLILSTNGPHSNLVIEDNTFYDNARDPWNDEINSEIQGSSGSTGIIRNNGIYRADPSINFFAPSSDWSGFSISNNRELEYSSVNTLPRWWDFDTNGDLQGWNAANDWNGLNVMDGTLNGISSDVDPYIHSPPIFVDSTTTPYVWVRMSQTAGAAGQIFYTTDTDPVWNAAKSVFFTVQPDGQMHDYFINLDEAGAEGVITQIRVDPTTAPGSTMQIDHVRLTDSTDIYQLPEPPPQPEPLEAVFTSIASEDGYVTESFQDSGVGGSINSGSSTFRVGDTSSNRAYRSFLSFDTASLPANAVVVEATVGITRVGNPTGNVPIGVANSQFGDILVDLATPAFGGVDGLQLSDWQSAATKLGVSKFAWPAYLDGMTIYSRLEDVDNPLINLDGKTQFRIRYQFDDDQDGQADYMSYASGNHPNASYRPSLTVKYYINTEQTVAVNTGTEVSQGTSGNPITTAMLQTTDAESDPAYIVYTLDAAPTEGVLRRNNVPLSGGGQFTQADIDNGVITYDHFGNGAVDDSFGFSVDDGLGTASTGVFSIAVSAVVNGDFNDDGLYTCDDVDALVHEIAAGTHSPTYDLTDDQLVDAADLDAWLGFAGAAPGSPTGGAAFLRGDATLNGIVDGQDFLAWNNHKFTADSGWCGGDFNADGVTDGQDFIVWNDNKFQAASQKTGVPVWFSPLTEDAPRVPKASVANPVPPLEIEQPQHVTPLARAAERTTLSSPPRHSSNPSQDTLESEPRWPGPRQDAIEQEKRL